LKTSADFMAVRERLPIQERVVWRPACWARGSARINDSLSFIRPHEPLPVKGAELSGLQRLQPVSARRW